MNVMIQIRPISDLRNKFTDIERSLDVADSQAVYDPTRYSHEDVFKNLRKKING